jgi:hypothetical protein
MLVDVSTVYPDVRVTLLVDNATERILRACKFETSADGYSWVSYVRAYYRFLDA